MNPKLAEGVFNRMHQGISRYVAISEGRAMAQVVSRPDSIPNMSMWDLRWIKWQWDGVSSELSGFYPISIIPTMVHTIHSSITDAT